MSKKKRKKLFGKSADPAVALRNLEKGDAKSALKQARVCFRRDPSHDNRMLLERAYFARVEQLHRMRLPNDAKSILRELIEFKPQTAEIVEKIPRWQVVLGLEGADNEAVLAADPSLAKELIDRAVLDHRADIPRHIVSDINFEAEVVAVRKAFIAVEQGDDEQANELLSGISRTSPLADWRLFVRGLIAYYQDDQTRAESNWNRLDADRPARRIARTLLATRAPGSAEVEEDLKQGVRKLENHANNDPVVELMNRLAVAWRQGNHARFFRHFQNLQQRFFKSHEALVRQVVDIVWKRAAHTGDDRLLAKLMRTAPAPLVDPQWHRAKMLTGNHPESCVAHDEVIDTALAYADELKQLDRLQPAERPIASAIGYHWCGFVALSAAHAVERASFLDEDDENYARKLKRDAAAAFRKSIQAYPKFHDAYFDLAQLHEDSNELKKAARVMEKLAAADPNCFEAAIWLANYYLENDQPDKSDRHVKAARRIRPRDPHCMALSWNQVVTTVRCLATKRQFEAARHELQHCEQVAPDDLEPYTIDVLRAGVEFKAKNSDAGHRIVEEAIRKVPEPVAVWLQMSAVARRMRVDRQFIKLFEDRFKKDIKKKPTSDSAGRMARFLFTMRASKAEYTGRKTHERLLTRYLERATRIAWRDHDLRNAIRFLRQQPRQMGLVEQFVEVGKRRFPETPHYHYWIGMLGWEMGPWACDIEASVASLERAIELHQNGEIKLFEAEIDEAKERLSVMKDYLEEDELYGEEPFEFFENSDDDGEDAEPGGFLPLPDDPVFEMLLNTMPSSLRRELESIAKQRGMSFGEVLRDFAMSSMRGGDFE